MPPRKKDISPTNEVHQRRSKAIAQAFASPERASKVMAGIPVQRAKRPAIEYSLDPLGEHQERAIVLEALGRDDEAEREREIVRQGIAGLDELRRRPGAVAVRTAAKTEARKQWDHEAEERSLEWCRKNHGHLGGPYDPTFDVPLANGGEIALLMCADLSTQAGADHFFTTHTTLDDSRPSLDQLRMAQAIGRGLAAAIRNGNGPGDWELVRRAYDALDAILPNRCTVVEELASLRAYVKGDDEMRESFRKRGRPAPIDGPDEGVQGHASRAHGTLCGLDARFGQVDVATLIALVSDPKLGPPGIAAKLSLACGAFEDTKRTSESDAAAVKRVKKLYEKAMQYPLRKAVS